MEYQIIFLDEMTVNETIVANEDNSYTIFVNNRLCEYKKKKAALHALKHIKNGDFEKIDVQEIELSAHIN